MTDKYGKDGKANIVEIQGTVGSSAQVDRMAGFKEGIKDFPGLKIIKSQTGDFTRAKGKEVMEAFLKSDGKNIQVLYAHNDDMAMGAIQAIEEYGLKPGIDITIVSIDGIKDAFTAMSQGKTVEKWIKSTEGVFTGAVDFQLRKGEIHTLMGENGAGKSTLIKVLTGVHEVDEGKIILEGKEIRITSTQDAQKHGISTVYQEVNLCSNLSVAENIYIGREPMKRGSIDWDRINKNAEKLLEDRLNLKIDVKKLLSYYSVAIQQLVAIARAVDISRVILILDESTSSLDSNEVKELFKAMRKLKAEGMSIVFVTHFLDQVYQISDRITVLRNGKFIGTYEAEKLSRIDLISKMVGKEFNDIENNNKKSRESSAKSMEGSFVEARQFGKRDTLL